MRRTPIARRLLSLLLAVTLIATYATFAVAGAAPAPSSATDPYTLMPQEVYDYVPPATESVTLTQPDGTAFTASLNPMELGGGLETADGYTVVPDINGWWNYATLAPVTNEVVPSGIIVGKDSPVGLTKQVGVTEPVFLDGEGNDLRNAAFDMIFDQSAPINNPNAGAGGPGLMAMAAAVTQPVIYRYVAILVDFPDCKFLPYQTKEWFQQQLMGVGTFPTGSLSDFYLENSYGKFQPEMEVFGPITATNNMATYDINASGGRNVGWMISNDVGPKLAELGIDWEAFDNDKVVYTSQGKQYRSVDMTVVIHAGDGQEATGLPGQIWSHATTTNFVAGTGTDGKEIRIRACNTTPAIGFNIGVVAHEGGHSIGESDYYATNYLSAGTGDWDLMAGGSWIGNAPAGSNPTHMNPFSKIRQGWITPTQITATTTGIELRPRSLYPDILEIPLGGTGSGTRDPVTGIVSGAEERLFVEYVSNEAQGAIFDKGAPASGLIVWHYDAGGSQNNAARYRIAVEEYGLRDGIQDMRANYNRGEPTDPWSDTAIGMTPWTSPNTDRATPLGGVTSTGWSLVNIAPIGETIKFDIVQGDIGRVSIDKPHLTTEPIIQGQGPATISATMSNNTVETLTNVKVRFYAAGGDRHDKLAETTIASIGPNETIPVTAIWQNPTAGKYTVRAEASIGSTTVVCESGSLRIFARPAPVLLVDDDDGYNAEEAYEGVLTSLGVPYVTVTGGASLATMQQYDLVIWHAGQAGRQEGQLTKQQVADIKAFLDGGGKLWMATPRLGAAMASTGSAKGVDPVFYRDYFGSAYPMSNQAGGGTVTGLGNTIGGTASFALRSYPGRDITDFIDVGATTVGTATPLFSWSLGHYMGMEVIGDAAHNNFRNVYFGFCLSQVISGTDRLTLAHQVLDSMGIATVTFQYPTYQISGTHSVKITVHDPKATAAPVVTVTSVRDAAGITVKLRPSSTVGYYEGEFSIKKVESRDRDKPRSDSRQKTLLLGETDTMRASFTSAAGRAAWATAAVKVRIDKDVPPTVFHDNIFTATDAQGLPITAVVTDDISVKDVYVYYRAAGLQPVAPLPSDHEDEHEREHDGEHNAFYGEHAFSHRHGTGSFTRIKMTLDSRNSHVYSALIPAASVTEAGVEYYIVATDSKGNTAYHMSSTDPQFVVIQPRTIGLSQ